MRCALLACVTATFLTFAAGMPAQAQAYPDGKPIDRTVLPVKEPPVPTFTQLDARDVKPPPRWELSAPKSAPNVLIILIDDMGFGMPSTFGGPVHMPTADQLAREGLRFNDFNTTAMCSPTRVALLGADEFS